MTRFKAALAICLALCLAIFIVRSIAWPFVYDAALIRYADFLMQHHLAPYRDIQDYNLPGSYFFDWLVVHTLGASALAWRVYDFLLMAVCGLAMYCIARPYSRFAAFYGAALFALFHARDGAGQAGQRDLVITALVLAGVALLLHKPRKNLLPEFLFGLCIGIAATIKPTAVFALPMYLLSRLDAPTNPRKPRQSLFPYLRVHSERRHLDRSGAQPHRALRRGEAPVFASLSTGRSTRKNALSATAVLGGFIVAPLAALVWLWRMHAVAGFWRTLTIYIPMHAHLGDLGLWPLLTRCITASHGTVLAIALVLAFTGPDLAAQWELRRLRVFLAAGIIFGLISYFVQAKGYPDHRYPFAAFLFLFAAVEFTCALRSPGYRRVLGMVGLLFGTVLSVLSTARAIRDRWPAEPVASLTRDLNALGGLALSNNIQCLDTVDGCIEALYDMRLVQSTGFVYDEFLFTAPDAVTPQEVPVRAELRQRLLAQLASRPPRIIVITPWLFPLGPDDYAKLGRWPGFTRFLDHCYSLHVERDFPTRSSYQGGYRLYLRQPACALSATPDSSQ